MPAGDRRQGRGPGEALEAWWSAAIHSSSPHWRSAVEEAELTGEAPELNQDQYTVVLKKIFKAMAEKWDAAEAEAIAETEWDNDRRGLDYLDAELFKDGLWAFETEFSSLAASAMCELGAPKAHTCCVHASSACRKSVPQV